MINALSCSERANVWTICLGGMTNCIPLVLGLLAITKYVPMWTTTIGNNIFLGFAASATAFSLMIDSVKLYNDAKNFQNRSIPVVDSPSKQSIPNQEASPNYSMTKIKLPKRNEKLLNLTPELGTLVSSFLNATDCYHLTLTNKFCSNTCSILGNGIWYQRLFGELGRNAYTKEERFSFVKDVFLKGFTWVKYSKCSSMAKHIIRHGSYGSRKIDVLSSVKNIREKSTSADFDSLIRSGWVSESGWLQPTSRDFLPHFVLLLDNNGKVRSEMYSLNFSSKPRSDDDMSLLNVLILWLHLPAVKFFLEHGANPNQSNKENFSGLQLAIAVKDKAYKLGKRNVVVLYANQTLARTEEMVTLLLSHPDIFVDLPSESDGYTPLTLACLNGYTDIMKMLIQKGAHVKAIPSEIRLSYIENVAKTPQGDDDFIASLIDQTVPNNSQVYGCSSQALAHNYPKTFKAFASIREPTAMFFELLKKFDLDNKTEFAKSYLLQLKKEPQEIEAFLSTTQVL